MPARKLTPNTASEWGSALTRWFGMTGLAACFLVWLITGQVEPLFITAFGGLLAAGQGADALAELRSPPAPPIPPGDPVEVSD